METKNLLLVGLAALAAGSLSGCNFLKPTDEDENIITVEFVKAGFGLKPYEALKTAFEAKHPEYKIKLVPNRSMHDDCFERVKNGGASDVMIYNRNFRDIKRWAAQDLIYDLKDVINEDIGGGKTIWTQLDDNGKKACEYNGGYYLLPEYININGFVYNETLFNEKGWTIPKTSKELIDLCDNINTAGITPLAWAEGSGNADGYLYYADEGFACSYEGVANLDTFYKMDSAEVYAPSKNVGKLKGLELQKTLYGETSSYAKTYNDIMTAQNTIFSKTCAMTLNGSWFENEMAETIAANPNQTIKIFPVPEVSDDSNKVLHADGYTCQQGKQGVIHADFTASMFIPKNAQHVKGAIEYLKWSSTPEACEIWTANSNAVRPFNYDYSTTNSAYSNMSEFGKSVLDIADKYQIYVPVSNAPIAILGHGMFRPSGGYWFYRTLNGEKTPAQCVEEDYSYCKKVWADWVEEANLKL